MTMKHLVFTLLMAATFAAYGTNQTQSASELDQSKDINNMKKKEIVGTFLGAVANPP